MPFELFMGVRFLREGRMQTVLIWVGVAVGVGVMVFLSALINGLQGSLIRQTLSAQPHVVVRPADGQARSLVAEDGVVTGTQRLRSIERVQSISQFRTATAQIEALPGVVATAATVAGSALVQKGNVVKSVALRGIEPDRYRHIIPLDERLTAGELRLVGSQTVVGVELAKDLGLAVGDKVRLTATPGTQETFTVTGIFDLGNKDINQRWVFVSLRAAQTMLGLAGEVSTIEVRVNEVFGADEAAARISSRTGLVADSWMRLNRQLLVALKSQSSSSYMIQFFVMLAVALGIASVLVVSVVQKSREIGIMKATGTSTSQITRIFLFQGGAVGLCGALGGCGLGTVLALFFAALAQNPDGSPTFPVDLNAGLYLSATAIATAVGLIAAVVPARRAARLDPATVIRYG